MAVSEKTAQRHQKWKREILEIIRSTPDASRISVKRRHGLSMDSTLSLINELIDEGLVVSLGKLDSGRAGRRMTLLRINDSGCYFIGVRFSAGGVSGVLMDFGKHAVCTDRQPLPEKPSGQDVVEGIAACVDRLLGFLGERRARLRGIGIGAPGIIDLERGVLVRYAHIPGWEQVPLCRIVEARYGVPVYMEHGVKCAARAVLSEPRFSGVRDALFFQMGRGVNLCAVIGGRIHSGANYLSGEIGGMRCGPDGTLESLASTDALLAKARQALDEGDPRFDVLRAAGAPLTEASLTDAAGRGCEGARALIERAGEVAACALSAAVMIVNPECLILSGALCASDLFEQTVRRGLAERCIPESVARLQTVFLLPDPRTDTIGAAMLPFARQFGVR